MRASDIFNHRRHHAVPALYVYDFGDDWQHVLAYEGEELIDRPATYPRCVSGSRRCPPEDCGGVHGYLDFLIAISDPTHPEHAPSVAWTGGSYDPEAFDPAAVVFEDPQKRWKVAFENDVVSQIERRVEQSSGQAGVLTIRHMRTWTPSPCQQGILRDVRESHGWRPTSVNTPRPTQGSPEVRRVVGRIGLVVPELEALLGGCEPTPAASTIRLALSTRLRRAEGSLMASRLSGRMPSPFWTSRIDDGMVVRMHFVYILRCADNSL